MAEEPGVEQAWSYFSPGSPPSLRSGDGSHALLLARIGGDIDQVPVGPGGAVAEVHDRHPRSGHERRRGAEVGRQSQEEIRHDLKRAEIVSVPILLGFLVFVFGSV